MEQNKFENYVGRTKTVNGQYGEFYNISLGPNDIEKLVRWAKENEKGWVNLTMAQGKSGEYTIKRNTFNATKQEQPQQQFQTSYQPTGNEVLNEVNLNDEELPF